MSEPAGAAIELVIEGRPRDLGGFSVRRVLPYATRRMVGPFIFLDEMGPIAFPPGNGIDVRPHPHIGLATVTYLFEGALLHRDSLGTVQEIRPGEVNWMSAGRGIAHSERTPPAQRQAGSRLHGVQSWVALPAAQEESAPSFANHPASALPVIDGPGRRIRLILGALWGARSPVVSLADAVYADIELADGARLEIPSDYGERGLYLVSGGLGVDRAELRPGQLAVLGPEVAPAIVAHGAARLMLLGGAAESARHIWWNFVSTSEARIEQAKEAWRRGGFAPVPGETDFIPLPE